MYFMENRFIKKKSLFGAVPVPSLVSFFFVGETGQDGDTSHTSGATIEFLKYQFGESVFSEHATEIA